MAEYGRGYKFKKYPDKLTNLIGPIKYKTEIPDPEIECKFLPTGRSLMGYTEEPASFPRVEMQYTHRFKGLHLLFDIDLVDPNAYKQDYSLGAIAIDPRDECLLANIKPLHTNNLFSTELSISARGQAGRKPKARKPKGRKPKGRKPKGRKPKGRKPEGPKAKGRKPQGPKPMGKPEAPKPMNGLEPEGTEPDDSELEVLEPEGTESEGSEPEGSEPEGSEPEGSEPEGSEPEGSEPEGSEPECVETECSKPKASKPEGLEPEGLEREGLEREGLEPEGLEPEGLEREGLEPEGLEPEGIEPEGSEPEGSEPEAPELESSELEGSKPEGSEPESSEPEGSKLEDSKLEGSTPEGSKPEGSEAEGPEPVGRGPVGCGSVGEPMGQGQEGQEGQGGRELLPNVLRPSAGLQRLLESSQALKSITVEQQIEIIDKTFVDIEKPLGLHPTKPHSKARPISSMPIFPETSPSQYEILEAQFALPLGKEYTGLLKDCGTYFHNFKANPEATNLDKSSKPTKEQGVLSFLSEHRYKEDLNAANMERGEKFVLSERDGCVYYKPIKRCVHLRRERSNQLGVNKLCLLQAENKKTE